MNGTISLFIHSFIFIIYYGIMLLQDKGLTDKIVLCDMEWGILREKSGKVMQGRKG
jgi:hypothetical protein